MPETLDFAALFAADQEPTTVEFSVGGREGFVEFRPMDASAMARFTQATQHVEVDLNNRVSQMARVQIDVDAQEMLLLMSTVARFRFWTRGAGGDWAERTDAHFAGEGRRKLFASLAAPFRRWLVEQALEVNGLAPFPPVSAESPTSE